MSSLKQFPLPVVAAMHKELVAKGWISRVNPPVVVTASTGRRRKVTIVYLQRLKYSQLHAYQHA